jgi:Protein of unknown function (DUF4019)
MTARAPMGSASARRLLTAAASVALLAAILSKPARAAEPATKVAAVEAMQPWLTEIDAGQYEQSWKDASRLFEQAVTTDGWVAALQQVRAPLGACLKRQLVSSELQHKARAGPRKFEGDLVVAQFETSFANLKYAVETVSFIREADGSWKAAGYYIRP